MYEIEGSILTTQKQLGRSQALSNLVAGTVAPLYILGIGSHASQDDLKLAL